VPKARRRKRPSVFSLRLCRYVLDRTDEDRGAALISAIAFTAAAFAASVAPAPNGELCTMSLSYRFVCVRQLLALVSWRRKPLYTVSPLQLAPVDEAFRRSVTGRIVAHVFTPRFSAVSITTFRTVHVAGYDIAAGVHQRVGGFGSRTGKDQSPVMTSLPRLRPD